MSRRFERTLDVATDQTLVEPNWESILECVDLIRGGDAPVKDSIKLIQKRYHCSNPHVAHHALLVLEACVKNCGKKFLTEMASKENMDDLKNILISNPPENIKKKILELIQCWSSAFKENQELKIFVDTHNYLKMNGFHFPEINESKAMFMADSAPEWADGDNCYRCRVEFGMLTRKHHCRNCGQVFCDKCSSKQMTLPQLGIEKKVRVCEACYEEKQSTYFLTDNSLDDRSTNSKFDAADKAKKEEKEQEDLLLALALSQSEAEEQDRRNGSFQSQYLSTSKHINNFDKECYSSDSLAPRNIIEESINTQMENPVDDDILDSELAKYLDRDYWERKKRGEDTRILATAPPPSEISVSISSNASQRMNDPVSFNCERANDNSTPNTLKEFEISKSSSLNKLNSAFHDHLGHHHNNADDRFDQQVTDTSKFCDSLKERINIMNSRMRSNKHRGRSIVNDSAIHTLFVQLTELHSSVLHQMNKLEEKRGFYEGLQDRMAHIQEARQAIITLRDQHEVHLREKFEEEQRLRQQQLQQTLGIMRDKKHKMLLTERDAAYQRLQNYELQIQQQRIMQQQMGMPPNHGVYNIIQPTGENVPTPTTHFTRSDSKCTYNPSLPDIQSHQNFHTNETINTTSHTNYNLSQPILSSTWQSSAQNYDRQRGGVHFPPTSVSYISSVRPVELTQIPVPPMQYPQYAIPNQPLMFPSSMGMYPPQYIFPSHHYPIQQQDTQQNTPAHDSSQQQKDVPEELLISFD